MPPGPPRPGASRAKGERDRPGRPAVRPAQQLPPVAGPAFSPSDFERSGAVGDPPQPHRRQRREVTVRRTSGTVRLGTAPAVKFLTVRNLLTPSPRTSYDCVSANSLQWASRPQPRGAESFVALRTQPRQSSVRSGMAPAWKRRGVMRREILAAPSTRLHV